MDGSPVSGAAASAVASRPSARGLRAIVLPVGAALTGTALALVATGLLLHASIVCVLGLLPLAALSILVARDAPPPAESVRDRRRRIRAAYVLGFGAVAASAGSIVAVTAPGPLSAGLLIAGTVLLILASALLLRLRPVRPR